MPMTSSQTFLADYRRQTFSEKLSSSPAASGFIWPILSTVPGLFCWMLFASAAMPGELPFVERLSAVFGSHAAGGLMVTVWGLAAISSIAALIYFSRRPKSWHITLCMGLHLAGLLFSVLLLGGLTVWAIV